MASFEFSRPDWTTEDEAFLREPFREMAALLSCSRTGTILEDDIFNRMCDNVADEAEELGLYPDQVNAVLVMHDEELVAGEKDWFTILAEIKALESQEE